MDISIAGSMYYILKKGSPFVSTRLVLPDWSMVEKDC